VFRSLVVALLLFIYQPSAAALSRALALLGLYALLYLCSPALLGRFRWFRLSYFPVQACVVLALGTLSAVLWGFSLLLVLFFASRISTPIEHLTAGLGDLGQLLREGLPLDEEAEIVDQAGQEGFFGERLFAHRTAEQPGRNGHGHAVFPDIAGAEMLADAVGRKQTADGGGNGDVLHRT
jgi:hypothetical protein